jgi:hypothetical protein
MQTQGNTQNFGRKVSAERKPDNILLELTVGISGQEPLYLGVQLSWEKVERL